MKHRVAGKKFSRDHGARKALFKGLINSLILHNQIKTTESRAKRTRSLVEKLVTKAKKGSLHSRRLIFAFLQNSQAVDRLMHDIAPVFKGRPGGFTRVVKIGGLRRGDSTKTARIEWVENIVATKVKKSSAAEKAGSKKVVKKSVKKNK